MHCCVDPEALNEGRANRSSQHRGRRRSPGVGNLTGEAKRGRCKLVQSGSGSEFATPMNLKTIPDRESPQACEA
jgi:hypothetical protein